MKCKIPLVVRGVQMYWNFSTQNLNSAIALLGTQTVNLLGTIRHYSDFRGCHPILRRATIVAHSTDSFAYRLNHLMFFICLASHFFCPHIL